VLFVNVALQFLLSTTPGQQASTFDYLVSDFASIDGRLRTPGAPAFFGNSSRNPARFPSPNVTFWAYLDDLVVNKTGTADYQPALNDAWQFILSWFSNYSYTTPFNLFPPTSTASVSTASVAGRFRVSPELPSDERLFNIVMNEFSKIMPSGLSTPGFMRTSSADTEALVIADTPSDGGTPWTTLLNITFALGDTIVNKNLFCYWDSQINGTDVRVSFGFVAFYLFVFWLIISGLALAFPGFASVVLGMAGAFLLIASLEAAIIYSTGVGLFCFPAVPPIVWSAMAMQFIYNTVLPDCIALGSGLIANLEFVVIAFFFFLGLGHYFFHRGEGLLCCLETGARLATVDFGCDQFP
jgi:hypothetical protein